MKSNELRALPIEDLVGKLEESVKKLYLLRVRATLKELDNTAQIRDERRNVARIKQAIEELRKGAAVKSASVQPGSGS